jgi:hypothetical protein
MPCPGKSLTCGALLVGSGVSQHRSTQMARATRLRLPGLSDSGRNASIPGWLTACGEGPRGEARLADEKRSRMP